MNLTFNGQRDWIEKEAMSIREILDRFPPLKSKPQLIDEFERMLGEGMSKATIERWALLVRIMGYDSSNLRDELDTFYEIERKVQPNKTKKGEKMSLIKQMTNSGELGDINSGVKEPTVSKFMLRNLTRMAKSSLLSVVKT